ncbi:lysophospholipase L1-like esterase [Marmoricola sp. OAE513]|uniref:SGNH/GDSL hydrolase family protein n=1 Tax=Marmoricola sp. OAE513 TaxID=2817894 RepID=UPI001AE3C7FD
MKLRTLPLGLLCAALALGPAVVGVGSSASAEDAEITQPVKIMLSGDSITQGFDGDYTWRYRLDRELRRQGVKFDFVGPYKYTYGGANHYQVSSGWDTDHAATGGTRLRTQIEELPSQMYNADPDVLVALYGTTDLLPRTGVISVQDEIKDLRDYITEARQANGNIQVVLGEVTTRRIPNRVEFNNAVNALAQQETANPYYPDSRVVVADLDYPGWDPTKNTYDTTHPNPVGEAIIAQRVGWALNKVGVKDSSAKVLPRAPEIKSAGLIYNPPWAPKIRVAKGRKLVVDWYQTKWLNKPQLMQIQVKRLKTRRTATSGWMSSSQYISARLKKGKYQIRIHGRRQAMISPWSRTWTVTVR